MDAIADKSSLAAAVRAAVAAQPVVDMHTHLYDARFGPLLLRGVDELLSYHYLAAELFRANPRLPGGESLQPEAYRAMPAAARADIAWKALFIEQTPLSEAARGVAACLSALGRGLGGGAKGGGAAVSRDLGAHRALTADWPEQKHIDEVLRLANVKAVVMTNDPFDDEERPAWEGNRPGADARFWSALRLDRLFADWPLASQRLRGWGFDAAADWSRPESRARAAGEVRRFLLHWVDIMRPVYLALSAGASFDPDYDRDPIAAFLIHEAVLPVCRERGLPLALMIGVWRGANPRLAGAGDSVRLADLAPLARLCREYPGARFLVTLLARENQHELCVLARKFGQLHPFGCWWFLNNPSLIHETTLMRLELLGPTFTLQHSDARVLDQLLYKWRHSRETAAAALEIQYGRLWDSGWRVTGDEVARDVERLLGGNFLRLIGK